jgi:PfaD family protein
MTAHPAFVGPRPYPASACPFPGGAPDVLRAVRAVREPAHLVITPDGGIGAVTGDPRGLPVRATLPPLHPEWLGDRGFCQAHGTRFPYIAGEMANGIATTGLVTAMARAGMLGFYGAAGMPLEAVEQAVDTLAAALPGLSNWGVNLIHAPQHPAWEDGLAELLIHHRVPAVSVSAFMDLTPAVVLLAASGLRTAPDGRIIRPRRLLAKVSRAEVAERFLTPPPPRLLAALAAAGRITHAEAELAARLPVAGDLTVEADSGGHTDSRPLPALLSAVSELRDRLAARHPHLPAVRIGAAGGLGTPQAVAAAFAAGVAYVLTGSVNQTCVEAGLSEDAKRLVDQAGVADVIMAPASDMFELGASVQVLARGTLFGPRARQLHDAYRAYDSLEAIPAPVRERLERGVLGASFDKVWEETRAYWRRRDPAVLDRAEQDPRHRMALVFRWYLGRSSRWAIDGTTARRTDYQIWCGPAVGAFNDWARDSFLADPARRTVVQVARNLLEGAAVLTRAHQLRTYGVPVPVEAFRFTPRPLG